MQTNLLTDPQRAYAKSDFENILKAIGLNTILIASQRKDIHNQNGNHNSLSDSTNDVEEIIRVGYINALGDHYSITSENESSVDNQVLEFFSELLTDIITKINSISVD